MFTFTKQPSEVLDYDVDMSDWFSDIPLDDIETVVVSVTSFAEEVPTLLIGETPHPAYTLIGDPAVRFKVWLSGGTDLTDYIVTCTITTEQDRKKEVEFKVKVRDK